MTARPFRIDSKKSQLILDYTFSLYEIVYNLFLSSILAKLWGFLIDYIILKITKMRT